MIFLGMVFVEYGRVRASSVSSCIPYSVGPSPIGLGSAAEGRRRTKLAVTTRSSSHISGWEQWTRDEQSSERFPRVR